MTSADPLYVAARRALLDALFALCGHAEALVIAGAQAVYLHTGDGDLAIAPFTTDADLAVHPDRLSADPLIEAAMTEAGFKLQLVDGGHIEPGTWITTIAAGDQSVDVPVDLIVPTAASTGGGRRGARLGAHGKQAARLATGPEACLVDHAPQTIRALDPDDARSITANVAGPVALPCRQGAQDPRSHAVSAPRSPARQRRIRRPAPHAVDQPNHCRRDA